MINYGPGYCLNAAGLLFAISDAIDDLLCRYVAIVRPLKPRMSKTSARVTLLAIWISSALVSLPSLFYSTTWTLL